VAGPNLGRQEYSADECPDLRAVRLFRGRRIEAAITVPSAPRSQVVSSNSDRPSSPDLADWVTCPSCRSTGIDLEGMDAGVARRCRSCNGVGCVQLDPAQETAATEVVPASPPTS
jgi:DnaJ-class molecular chaperone